MTWLGPVLIFSLLAVIVWRESVHDRERKDLYNRLMARDLVDYMKANDQNLLPKSKNFIRKGMLREEGLEGGEEQ